MLKKAKVNIFFIIIAIIHFILVLLKTQYHTYFSTEQTITWITVKLVSFLLILLFWQLIPFIAKELKNNNKDVKDFLLYTSIYLVINITILFLIWPGYTHNEFLYMYIGQKNFGLNFFWHWLSSFEIAVVYNVLPFIWGVCIVNSILQSIIVGFCAQSVKKYLSKNFYWMIFIPLCFPALLIQNHSPIRLIFITWLTILFFIFLYTRKHMNIKSNLVSSLIGLLCAIIIAIRTEYLPLLVIYPIMVLTLKIFDKKAFCTFLAMLVISFSSIYTIQKFNMGETYELHNLCFVYEEVVRNNLADTNFEKDKEILQKVFIELDEKGHDSDLDLSNKENTKKALFVLIKMLIKNSEYFIKRSISLYTELQTVISSEEMYKPELNEDFIYQSSKEIKPINTTIRDNIIDIFTYGPEEKDLRYIYNPYLNLMILGFLFLYGVTRKEIFFLFYPICWLTVLFTILLTLPWANYLYLWAFFINTWLFLAITVSEILQNTYEFIKEKLHIKFNKD